MRACVPCRVRKTDIRVYKIELTIQRHLESQRDRVKRCDWHLRVTTRLQPTRCIAATSDWTGEIWFMNQRGSSVVKIRQVSDGQLWFTVGGFIGLALLNVISQPVCEHWLPSDCGYESLQANKPFELCHSTQSTEEISWSLHTLIECGTYLSPPIHPCSLYRQHDTRLPTRVSLSLPIFLSFYMWRAV